MPTFDDIVNIFEDNARKTITGARDHGWIETCPVDGCENVFTAYSTDAPPEFVRMLADKGVMPPALSRLDNKTYICSDCGQREALEDYFGQRKTALDI